MSKDVDGIEANFQIVFLEKNAKKKYEKVTQPKLKVEENKMCADCEKESDKREDMVLDIKEFAVDKFDEYNIELVGLLLELSECITEICDLELGKEATRIYEELTLHTLKFLKEFEEKCKQKFYACKNAALKEIERIEKERDDLVKKLAMCEKERDEERRMREQAEYDKEYFANELSKCREN